MRLRKSVFKDSGDRIPPAIKGNERMVKVEIDSMDVPLYCPLCGAELVTKSGFQPPCAHTLFMCVEDGGIEYCSEEVDEGKLEESIQAEGMDQATDSLPIKKYIKFAMYSEASMSNSACYVGIKTDLPKKP